MLNLNLRTDACSKRFVISNKYYEGKTLDDVKAEVESGDLSVLQRVKGFTSTTPGTKGFWAKFRRRLDNMVYFMEWLEERPPTVFFTVTPAENWWSSFHKNCVPPDCQIGQSTLDSAEDTSRRASNSRRFVTLGVQFFEYVLLIFLHAFLGTALGLRDYAIRGEMQERDAMHFHGYGYLDGAPSSSVLQRACDALQRYTSVGDGGSRVQTERGDWQAQVGAKPEEREALEDLIHFVDDILMLNGATLT